MCVCVCVCGLHLRRQAFFGVQRNKILFIYLFPLFVVVNNNNCYYEERERLLTDLCV